ncbi:hemicentin-1-like isoform X2 [Corticium candelabrum]|uniref:hemicentin-1-like isoform X2 n=1 Tax=Corticium candelabrum TaxID=121492 RepID=UPI002E269B79|nr:hemicentin-1-like isoform X2 [Corticium candelabrum]
MKDTLFLVLQIFLSHSALKQVHSADVSRVRKTAGSNQTVGVISVAPRYLTLSENINQVRFQCYINGRPAQEGQTRWIRDGRRIYCVKSNRIFACGNILIIQHVSVRDSGHYRCVSSSNNQSFYQVSVVVPASIINSKDAIVRVDVAALKSVQLECHVRQDSFPKSVEVLWQYGDSYIATGSTLQLRDIDQNKTGVYICSASNGYGYPATKSFYIVELETTTTMATSDDKFNFVNSMSCKSPPSVGLLSYMVITLTLCYEISLF